MHWFCVCYITSTSLGFYYVCSMIFVFLYLTWNLNSTYIVDSFEYTLLID